MTTPDLISRPQWSRNKVQKGPLRELFEAMPGFTESKFAAFKKYTNSRARILGLDKYLDSEDQDRNEWTKLIEDCRKEFPELERFEDYWPIDVYYSKLTVYRRVKAAQRGALSSTKRKAPFAERGSDDEGSIKSTRSKPARSVEQPETRRQRVLQLQELSSESCRGPNTSPVVTAREGQTAESSSNEVIYLMRRRAMLRRLPPGYFIFNFNMLQCVYRAQCNLVFISPYHYRVDSS
ncbi:hypothetical protein C8R45DRAFT_1004213 [Mycena sanguinolenta]|nr:hypothetical protein C8R45DRAFT_1004213 [Mycena sanguinolenta]